MSGDEPADARADRAPDEQRGYDADPRELSERAMYRLLTGLVVPRPIAWVSTRAPDGGANVAPHSYYNVVSSDPPVVHFTSVGVKDTLANVRANGEFVINVVSADLLEAMNVTAADLPAGEDELAWAGLETAPAATVSAPRVAAAKAHLECTVRGVLSVGNGHMVLGDVGHVHVAGEVVDGGRVDQAALRAVGRLSGSGYTIVDDVVERARPSWQDLRRPR
jgi:flavin reductase (DIM6/NTAB) family NADH-FMN oxidoreductase RutF